ncbi:hypothetical protein DNU06_08470 [Putridiphycobacter roseus]|uniref:DUF4294 domain-containing protein n=1 Tax=Putridiphycobacter roseus TaxID=2219161 RepID=A0A2W1ND15_9FLAO|nr:DUF4294 domain-containing protein [Putridiphycobacter roseus]PZE17295.1 hypothetical protein DNU06_08470 [Putridiphycobacter roseus]
MKLFLFSILVTLTSFSFAQVKDSTFVYYHHAIDVLDKDFVKKYNYLKPKVLKVYPYALYAADVLDQVENDLESIKRRRKRNKHCKDSYKDLRSEFKYAMLDLYISEGKILMSLVSRETGRTVYEIVKKYRGAKDAMVFNLMGKMFEQDIKSAYVKKDNYVIEYIIREIESGKLKMDAPKLVSKTDFKAEEARIKKLRKKNKERAKENKKRTKAIKKTKRKADKLNH